ncbi:5-formyltetrahydrofolate cyclo-ligase [Paramagnetospirillum magnetotacticum MS-1]|uniref:5-formyltetrahydrofolate cyclo-ligase n=1 Tax=Paramagnetospirillum magnetotacticum MS-1 TaxID=272627 RepID=A0A0C2YB90_PARME|nr:5-formyltetrahydrofolate cyclo-ligase [Paramagnetospirillum magnetotacticum]KIL97014.1 5-formyltetrahydrofolate cyclo-ligase [Paramagnetospirillum magnetotacticum MS-1]
MTETSPPLTKTRLRQLARRTRAEAALRDPGAGRSLAGLVHSLGLAPKMVVAGYWPLKGEMDPLPLMEALAAEGHLLALPAVTETGGTLEFRPWTPGEVLEPGPHGTRHPSAASPIVPQALLVPLLAFDRRGFRLGYGGGYYDRTLSDLRRRGAVPAIGLAFAAQEVERVPTDPWDIALDLVATELGVIVTAAK